MTVKLTSEINLNLMIYFNDQFEKDYLGLAVSGEVLFYDLICSSLGDYMIKSYITGAFDAKLLFTVSLVYMKMEFLNNVFVFYI